MLAGASDAIGRIEETAMSPSEFFWWVGAGALIVAELLTGTFYLLMIALEFIAGALADLAGTGPAAQYAIAALVALAAVLALRRTRYGRRRPQRDTSANPDMNPDVGATLEVPAWRDGRARVQYRGAEWDVELAPGTRADARHYQIAAVHGNRLVVVEKKPTRTGHPLSTTKE
jgi:membrane protein implicated in regulation of membrane protease activity